MTKQCHFVVCNPYNHVMNWGLPFSGQEPEPLLNIWLFDWTQ